MYNINQNYQNAINAPSRRIRGRVTIKNKVLSDGVSSIDYISSITGNEMSIGSTNASTVDIKFKTLIEGLQERELIKVSFTIETESGLVERQIGEFYLTEIKLDRNNKTTTIKAVDKMGFLNDNYNSKLHYPVSARAVLEEIISETNLRIKPSLTITNAPIILNKLEKVTYREVLGYLAQLSGAFVVFNNNGELEFRKLTRTEKRISKSAYLLRGLEIDEVEYRINGIIADLKDKAKTVFAVGSALGTQIRLTNPYMTNPHLSSIFDEYKKLRFNPFSLNWRGDPFVEVGDWVSIEISNGTYKSFPILSLKISYSGGLKSTISANVKGTASLTTEYKGTVQRQIEFINARLGSTGNLVYADTTEPKNPSEGDVWFKPNGAFTDLYIFEKGKWVLKTSTGDVEGVVTQITKSEILTKNFAAAIAKIIELDANRITTGSLSFERLSSKAVNSIREGLVTEEKLNDFVVNNEGLHQTLASEVKKEFESKKSELKGKDGTNSYIHMKYSNNANGQPMSDNSNSKYIGIYTGTSKTPPTNASEYSWTMVKGVDGKLPNFNLLIGSEMKDENSFKTNGGIYKFNKGDYNGKNSIEIINNNISSNVASLGVYFRSSKTSFKNGDKAVLRLPMYIYSDIPIDNGAFVLIKNEKTNAVAYALSITNSMPRDKWFVIEENLRAYRDFDSTDDYIFKVYTNKNGHLKIAEPYFALGDEIPKEWVPSLEDLKTHSLTASVRINGSYEGAKTSGVKFFVEVFYDGKKVTDGFNLTAKVQGAGLNKIQENATYNSIGELTNVYYPDGDKDGTPIAIQLDVEYKYTSTTCFARLDNLPSPELIEEVVKKYKTFESTLETFKSKIGEVNTKKFKLAYNIENICSESGIEKKGNDLYFNAKTPLKANKEYYVLADLDDVPSNQKTRIYLANNNGDSKEISNGLNIWRVSFSSEQSRVNIYPLGSDTKVKNVEIYEVPEIEAQDNSNIYKSHKIVKDEANNVFVTITPTERLLLNKIYKVEIKTQGDFWEGSKWKMQYSLDASKEASKTFLKGTNTWIFRSFNNQDEIHFQIPNGVTVVDVKLFKLNYLLGYKSEFNISTIFSEIEQTKNQIRSAVTENNFGTVLTQNAKSLKLAWNNLSKYFQFEDESLVLYEGINNSSKKRVKLDYTGVNFYSKNGEFSGAVRGYYKPVSASWLNSDKYYAGMNFIIENNGRIGWFEETQEWGTTWEAPLLAYNYSDGKNDNKYANQLVAFKDFIMENQLTVKGKLRVRGVVGDAGGSGNESAVFEGRDVNITVAGLHLKFRNGILVDS